MLKIILKLAMSKYAKNKFANCVTTVFNQNSQKTLKKFAADLTSPFTTLSNFDSKLWVPPRYFQERSKTKL